ncbi:hypothetical protein B5M42_010560 [Paenibacillus athensensis]|uniref:hypothetical protein n=1 Tax=Paenibacillus athensensis TaxID=1967502 RepID=UPI00142F9D26|nr:hypothetical protein [Paenibacillus athensensis]MCD1259279.1 hypothetical protein [Paenibacillus athensensis]
MLLTNEQKRLVLEVLRKEKRRLFSRHKGKLLDRTIADLAQMLRNEAVNDTNRRS